MTDYQTSIFNVGFLDSHQYKNYKLLEKQKIIRNRNSMMNHYKKKSLNENQTTEKYKKYSQFDLENKTKKSQPQCFIEKEQSKFDI